MGGENLPGNQEANIMIEVYYAEDDETIGKSRSEEHTSELQSQIASRMPSSA